MSEAAHQTGGTVVQLPQPQPTLDAKIAQRQAAMDKRKRELLVEARSARLDWIMAGSSNAEDASSTNSAVSASSDGINLLKNLQACTSNVLPSAPQVIESMLFRSNCDYHQKQGQQNDIADDSNSTTAGFVSSANKKIEQTLAQQNLPLASVMSADQSTPKLDGQSPSNESNNNMESNPLLNLPPIPSPIYYKAFLSTLCEPSSADLVLSIQKFCKTIEEAGRVMVDSMQQEGGGGSTQGGDGGGIKGADTSNDVASAEVGKGKGDGNLATGTTSTTQQQQQQEQNNHYASLAKAVRGFISKTLREMEDHDSFPSTYCSAAGVETATKQTDEKKKMEPMIKDHLQFCLEAFVYSKIRHDLYKVFLASTASKSAHHDSTSTQQRRTMSGVENELHTKMSHLQFVTPAHLEITCLKEAGILDVDLSYTIRQLNSIENIHEVSSPRQLLRTLLLAHRGVSVALNTATSGTSSNANPPGADDVLPTLILAILRATPKHLSTTLSFIEHFAPLSLMRGESGYAYTNICGALQFIQELDMEGHLSEVALVGDDDVGGKMGAVLHIGPEEFRQGLEECRSKIEEKKKLVDEKQSEEEDEEENFAEESGIAHEDAFTEGTDKKGLAKAKISARQVREARTLGKAVDLDWAIQQQQKHESMLNTATQQASQQPPPPPQSNVPPEAPPLPSNFSRSYSYLTTAPEHINLRDLPKLLAEYKLLVHATEKLLNERTVWMEQERKKQLELERTRLQQSFVTYVTGVDGDNGDSAVELANGH